jgi:phospholipase/lecithinase/hemolysin
MVRELDISVLCIPQSSDVHGPASLKMMLLPFLIAAGVAASSCAPETPKAVSNLISFGDSYTDEGRLGAYFANNGSAPPPGTSTSGSNFTSTGGYAWGHFASQQFGAKYYDYAGMDL